MIRALALKELREILGIAALGLGAGLIWVAGLTGMPPFAQIVHGFVREDVSIPFIDGNFYKGAWVIACVLALALGFKQSASENARGTYQFLLHRPVRRTTIFLTKLGTGLAVFLVCTGVPTLIYAIWAAIPGTHPSPFEWSMAGRAWQACLVIPLIYGGAFLSGLRPAHWFGTRLLPLVAASIPPSILLVFQWSWLVVLPLAGLSYVILASNICHVARVREYS